MAILEITNLGGPLTRKLDGGVNSGLAKYATSWGYDPYSKPHNLTWMEQPTSILTGGSVLAMKLDTSTGGLVYAVHSGGTISQINVNNGTNADLDSPSVISALSGTSFIFGASMDFYGSTEIIYVGHDNGVHRVGKGGAGPSIIGQLASNPRPFVKFIGKLYFGTGGNIGEIDSTNVITTIAKLSPALPSGFTVRDLDVTPDGNYLQITAAKPGVPQILLGVQDATSFLPIESSKFYWNGIDASYTSVEDYPGLTLTASTLKGPKSYDFGNDSNGVAIFSKEKEVSLPNVSPLNYNSTFVAGNMLGFAVPEYESSSTRFRTAIFNYGRYDNETPGGLFRLLRQNASVEDDIFAVPACINVSNRQYVPAYYALPNNIIGTGKIYFSTEEGHRTTTSRTQKLWRFYTVPTGTASIVAGVYETQTQLFSKKVKISEVRVYTEPLIGGNDFTVDLIGSGGSVLSGGSQRFQVATGSVATLADMVMFNPATAPTYAVGVRITNASVTGVANWTAHKIEIDHTEAGR